MPADQITHSALSTVHLVKERFRRPRPHGQVPCEPFILYHCGPSCQELFPSPPVAPLRAPSTTPLAPPGHNAHGRSRKPRSPPLQSPRDHLSHGRLDDQHSSPFARRWRAGGTMKQSRIRRSGVGQWPARPRAGLLPLLPLPPTHGFPTTFSPPPQKSLPIRSLCRLLGRNPCACASRCGAARPGSFPDTALPEGSLHTTADQRLRGRLRSLLSAAVAALRKPASRLVRQRVNGPTARASPRRPSNSAALLRMPASLSSRKPIKGCTARASPSLPSASAAARHTPRSLYDRTLIKGWTARASPSFPSAPAAAERTPGWPYSRQSSKRSTARASPGSPALERLSRGRPPAPWGADGR